MMSVTGSACRSYPPDRSTGVKHPKRIERMRFFDFNVEVITSGGYHTA